MLDLGVSLDVWPWIWLGVAVVFALVELTVLGGTFVLLPFAVSAFAASLLGFYDIAVEVQWLVFAGGGGLLFAILAQWARTFLRANELPPGVGADRLVGLTAIVTADIVPDDTARLGRIAVGGEQWGALTTADEPLPAGTRVRIAAVQGTRVLVVPVGPVRTEGEQP